MKVQTNSHGGLTAFRLPAGAADRVPARHGFWTESGNWSAGLHAPFARMDLNIRNHQGAGSPQPKGNGKNHDV